MMDPDLDKPSQPPPYVDPALEYAKKRWQPESPAGPDRPLKTKGNHTAFLLRLLLYVAIIAGLSIAGIKLSKPIENYYTLKNADPQMVRLAKDANMSRQGELVFLQTNPQLDTPAQFIRDCTTANSNRIGTAVLGCYVPDINRIYILQMPKELYAAEVNTAAYEMLHPVYLDYSQPKLNQLDRLIESSYKSLSANPSLSNQVAMFTKTEPGSEIWNYFQF